MAVTIGVSGMTGLQTAPNRRMATRSFFWPHRAPRSRAIQDADRLLDDVSTVIRERFWEEQFGAVAEEFTRDWQSYDNYRGQNSNMHLTESLMAAFEATHDSTYLSMAERIADLIIRRHAAANGWRLPEHFTDQWIINRAYSGNPTFRPYGTTPGHWLEWSRLLLQLWELGGRKLNWLPQCSKALFGQAVRDGWDEDKGGFYYTLDWDGSPLVRDRYWWPCCEGIGASAFLNAIDGDPIYERWYRQIWSFIATRFIDRENGGWRAQVDDALRPNSGPFFGKVDIYHSLQACLIPTLPTTGSVTRGLLEIGSAAALTVSTRLPKRRARSKIALGARQPTRANGRRELSVRNPHIFALHHPRLPMAELVQLKSNSSVNPRSICRYKSCKPEYYVSYRIPSRFAFS